MAIGAILVALVQFSSPRPVAAQSGNDPELVSRQALLLTKALTYDSRLLSRAGAQVTVAVLFKPGVAASKREAETWYGRFASLQGLRFLGLPFAAMLVPFGPAAETRAFLRENGVDAVMVCGGFDEDLPTLIKMTHDLKIISLASTPDQVSKGLSLGVFIIEGKNTLLFNLGATRNEGALFTSDILKLAKVIK